MSRSQAVRKGFAAIFREPLVYVAELAWRWAYGVAAALLVTYGLLLFLNSLPVSDRDALGLSGLIPGLFLEALASIFRGSGPKIVRLVILLAVGLGSLWSLASSLGRSATLTALLRKPARLRTVFSLHLLRMLIGLAAIAAYGGALVIAATLSRHPNGPGFDLLKFYFIAVVFSMIVSTAWSSASWYLSLGPIFAVRHGTGALDSLYDAAALVRRHSRQFTWVGLCFGILRAVVWFFSFFSFLTLLSLAAQAPPALALSVIFLMAAAYSAISNLLYLARMGSYLRILQWDEEQRSSPAAAASPEPPPPMPDAPPIPAM